MTCLTEVVRPIPLLGLMCAERITLGTDERGAGPKTVNGTPVVWRASLVSQLAARGWQDQSRFDDPNADIAVSYIDFVPKQHGVVATAGPPTFCIATFLDGQGRLATQGRVPFDVEPGTTVIFASTAPTEGENHVVAGRRMRIVDIRYEHRLLASLGGMTPALLSQSLLIDRSAPLVDAVMVGFKTPPALLAVAKSIADCRIEADRVRRIYLRAKALETFALTIDALDNAKGMDRMLGVADRRKVATARRMVEERFEESWTIPRLAQAVGLNERKLKLGFRTLVGRSVRAYLRDLRIEAAAAMLNEGRRVTDVAMTVGFNNISHFSKVFRELKGTPPSAYVRGAATATDH